MSEATTPHRLHSQEAKGLNYLHAITEIKIGCQPVISTVYIFSMPRENVPIFIKKGVSFYIHALVLQQLPAAFDVRCC